MEAKQDAQVRRSLEGDDFFSHLRGRRLRGLLLVPIFAAILLGWWFLTSQEPALGRIDSIAVLPFENASGKAEEDLFVSGLTEAVLVDLSRISALKVISGTSMSPSDRAGKSMQDIAKELGADVLLGGAARRENGKIRLSLRLLAGATGQPVWEREYVRDPEDILILSAEVARSIAAHSGATLTSTEEKRLTGRPRVMLEAFLPCLEGDFLLKRENYAEALESYRDAIAVDPTFAPASSGLALAGALLGDAHSTRSTAEVSVPAKRAALRALEIDPDLGDAHLALALIRDRFEWDWPGAESEFRRSLSLGSIWRTHSGIFYTGFLIHMGRFQEAVGVAERTLELDPFMPLARVQLGSALEYAGEKEAAREQYRQATRGLNHLTEAFSLAREGDFERALPHVEEVAKIIGDRDPDLSGFFGYVYAAAGQRDRALAVLDGLLERRAKSYASPCALADVYTGLGDADKAIEWLEQGYQERAARMVWLNVYWTYEPLRSDPRFRDLLRRMNFPD